MRPSPFVILALAATVVNLSAFLLSLHVPTGAYEANPNVRPGSLVSLGFSEGLVLLASFILRIISTDREVRIIVQAAVVALLSGDTINDLILVATGSQFFAIASSYTITAIVPALVAIWWIQSHVLADLGRGATPEPSQYSKKAQIFPNLELQHGRRAPRLEGR